MQFLRKATLGLAATLLFSTLFAFGLAFGIQRVFGTADALKGALKESSFYSSVVDAALQQAQKGEANQEGGEIPLDQPEVRKIIKEAASPALLQEQTEKVLDSAYAWLQGKTNKLEFTLSLDKFKTNLADALSTYLKDHLRSLPACQRGVTMGGDFDPFSAECLPRGADADQVAKQAKNEILQGEFLKDTTVSASDLKTEDGKTLEEQLKVAPQAYRAAVWANYATAALAVLLAIAVFFLSATRRLGLKKLAITFISVGVLVALLGYLLGFGAERAEQLAKEPLQQSALLAMQYIVADLKNWWMGYGITLLALGVGILVTLRLTRPKQPAAPEKAAELAAEPPAVRPAEPALKPPSKPKPKPPKKLIQ